MSGYLIVFFVTLTLLIIIIVSRGIVLVRQSEAMVVERLGSYNRLFYSGIHLLIPGIDRPREVSWRESAFDDKGELHFIYKKVTRIDLREAYIDFPKQNVITSDNVMTELNALLFFQVTDPKNVAYEITHLHDSIEKLAQTSLRNVIGEMTLDQTLASRDVINEKLREKLDEATDKWGVKINRVEVQDINPPEDIREAMEKVMRAERDRRAIVTEAEGTKTAAILESEGEQGAMINTAEAEKRSLILKSEGEAYARVRVAQADADAITRLSAALKGSNVDPTQYIIAVRYIEALKEMVSGKDNKVVYLPFEAGALLGSLGGIKELFKDFKIPTKPGGDDGIRQSDQGLA